MKTKTEFMKVFNSFSGKYNRYQVFTDFVTMSAISLHNAVKMEDELEALYLSTIKKYSKEEQGKFCLLLAKTVEALEAKMQDFLGDVFMDLEIGNGRAGQFFTPYHLSKMMAQVNSPGKQIGDTVENQGFVMLSEPACGAGGMVVAYAEAMIEQKINYQESLWAQAVDVDSTCSMMAYLQMALLGIPGEVITGNSISMEVRRVMRTPFHYLGGWDLKIRKRLSVDDSCESNSKIRCDKECKPDRLSNVNATKLTVTEQACFDF